jgi:hypothetical protein
MSLNKHLRNIVDEYLSMKQIFEHELLEITELIRCLTSTHLYYSNYFYPHNQKHDLFRSVSKIGYCNDEYYYCKQWAILLIY